MRRLTGLRLASTRTRFAVVAAILAAAIGTVASSPGGGDVVQAIGGTLGAGGEYHPLPPVRIFDTREPAPLDVAPFGRKATEINNAGPGFDVPVVGLGGLPAYVDTNGDGADDNVLAVAINITVINPSKLGFLTAYGKGAERGTSSVVNFSPGSNVPNMAILRPGKDGKLTINIVTPPGLSTSDLAIDLFGWFSSSSYGTRGARLVPAGPSRIFDSRQDAYGATPIGPNSSPKIQIRGADGYEPTALDVVPDNLNVVGVMVNITGVNVWPFSAPTFVSVLPNAPAAGESPSTSNLNFLPGQVRSVTAIVPVGPNGEIYLYNLAGEIDLIVDVVGYLVNGVDVATKIGRVVPLVRPYRTFDTREADSGDAQLGPGRAEPWDFGSFANDVRIGAESVGPQLGVIGNLTATGLTRHYATEPVRSHLTAYPPASLPPTVSNITIGEGETQPNLTLLRYGKDSTAAAGQPCANPTCVYFYNRAGYVDYLFDASAVVLADA